MKVGCNCVKNRPEEAGEEELYQPEKQARSKQASDQAVSQMKTNDQMRKKINNDHRDNLIGLSIPRFTDGHGSERVHDTKVHNQYALNQTASQKDIELDLQALRIVNDEVSWGKSS